MARNMSSGYKKQVGKAFDRKTKALAVLSLFISGMFAVGNLIAAIVYRSIWFAALSGFYAINVIFRAAVLAANIRCAVKYRGDEAGTSLYKWKIYLAGGLFLLLTDIAMGFAVGQLALGGKPDTGLVITIATAIYTAYKLLMSVINAIKAGRFSDTVSQALRALDFADSCMSVSSLTAALCTTFGSGGTPTSVTVAAVGGVMCVVVLGIALAMTVRAGVNIRREKQ